MSAPPGVDIVLESNENKFVGESCKVDEQCCWSLEAEECSSMRCAGSYPGGYCTRECAGENDSVCGLGGSCARVGSKFFCLRSCSLAGDALGTSGCRAGYSCLAATDNEDGGAGVCLPN